MYMTLRTILKPLSQRFYQHQIQGLENLPANSGAVLVSNHVSFVDSIFIPLTAPRQVYFLAKSDYFTTPGIKGKIMKWFFTSVSQLPMDRSGGEKSASSLAAAVAALQEGKLVGIYPEGTRSPDTRLYRGKTGAARLALEAGVPIIPIAQFGLEEVQRPGSNRIHLKTKEGKPIRVRTVIGQPIDTSAWQNWEDPRAAQRDLTDRVMEELSRMLDKPIIPVYAGDVKKLMTQRGISADQASQILLEQQGE